MDKETAKYFAVYVISTPPALGMPVSLYLEKSPKKIDNNDRNIAINIILTYYNVVTILCQGVLIFIAVGTNREECIDHRIAYIKQNPVYASYKQKKVSIDLPVYPYEGEPVSSYFARYPNLVYHRNDIIYQISKQFAMIPETKKLFIHGKHTIINDKTPYHYESVEDYKLRVVSFADIKSILSEYGLGIIQDSVFVSIRSYYDIVDICKIGIDEKLTSPLW